MAINQNSFFKSFAQVRKFISVQINRKERGIWQRRFWEYLIRDEADYWHHINYVHFKPMKHGLVKQVKQWPYSTFHKYVQAGVYSEDWCGEVGE